MRVFLTGATGFIGTAIIPELLSAGHQVLGLARNNAAADSLAKLGVEAHKGELTDAESLSAGARACDAVIHCAFIHDFSKFVENCEIDRRAIETFGNALAGSNRPLIITSGTGMLGGGRVGTEDDGPLPSSAGIPRSASEEAAALLPARGVRVSVMRLPQVHNRFKAGLVTYAIATARAKGTSAYVGDGLNRWPAAHVLDVAHLYLLALERGAEFARYHAVAEEGIAMKDIAESIGRGLNLPVVSLSPDKAAEHFGWLGMFAGLDLPASSAKTQAALAWSPTRATLLDDLQHFHFEA